MEFKLKDLDRTSSSRIEIKGVVDAFNDLVPNSRFTDLRDVYIDGVGYFDRSRDEFIVDCSITCTVEVPCAISLKPVEIELEATLSEVFLFGTDVPEGLDAEDVIFVDSDVLDLNPYIWESIVVDVPMKVVHPDLKEYPSGDGWSVLKEEDYLEQKKKEIDPRLAKLKDFKFD